MNGNVTSILSARSQASRETGAGASSAAGVPPNQEQAAEYISEVTAELINLARAADMKFMVYLLEMAYHEAFRLSTTQRVHDGGSCDGE